MRKKKANTEYQKRYYLAHPELKAKHRERQRIWRTEHHEEANQAWRDWAQANRERINARRRLRSSTDPAYRERNRARTAAWRARKREEETSANHQV